MPGLTADLSRRSPQRAGSHASAVRLMFDRVSPTYDLLNRLLSWGTDTRWRRRALAVLSSHAPAGPVLDSCAGTLDLAAGIERDMPERTIVAGDFAPRMLRAGRSKLARGALTVCDAMQLPFPDASFAGITCGFGMRNLADPRLGIAEAYRTLRPGGVFVVLEFFRPVVIWSRAFHAVYARLVLPAVGRLVSGDAEAYRYLSRSMQGFLSRAEFETEMRQVGFSEVDGRELTLGIASLVWGVK